VPATEAITKSIVSGGFQGATEGLVGAGEGILDAGKKVAKEHPNAPKVFIGGLGLLALILVAKDLAKRRQADNTVADAIRTRSAMSGITDFGKTSGFKGVVGLLGAGAGLGLLGEMLVKRELAKRRQMAIMNRIAGR